MPRDDIPVAESEQERPVASPRAARLRKLEDDPPRWLTESIGRAPSRNKTSAHAVLASPAIDDYRRDHGWQSNKVALGPQPAEPGARRAHARAQRAVEQMQRERPRREGCSAIADQRRRVVVPAAAGSSPVAHPSRNPCKAGLSTPDHEVPKSPRGQIRGQMRTQLPPGPRRMRSVMSPRYGSAGTSPSSTWRSTTSSSSRARATFAARRSRTSRTRARTPGSENSQDGTFCRAVHRRTEASCWSKASMAGSSQGASRR